MKIKNIFKSTLASLLLVATVANSAFAANYKYNYNFDYQLTSSRVIETDAKAFTSGGRGTAESTGILGGKTESQVIYTGVSSMGWDVYVDDTVKWSLKDNTLVISGNGVSANCLNAVSPFYDNVNIKTVIVEETVKQIDSDVFACIPNLETIFLMNANTALNLSILELPNLKAVIYGANLKDDMYVRHYAVNHLEVTNNYETIILSKNIAVPGTFKELFNDYNVAIRNDVNLYLTDLKDLYTQLTNNGTTIAATNTSEKAGYAIEEFANYEDKTSYETLLARARAYTQNLPQTAKNMLPNELLTGSTVETPNKTISRWAKADVERAEKLGIVPENLPIDFTQDITREQFCEIIAPMYEKRMGKEITITVDFYDTNNTAVKKLASDGIVNGISKNFFKPNDPITRAEVTVILTRIIRKLNIMVFERPVSFKDIEYHWAEYEIKLCIFANLITGTSATTFSPDDGLTIEQAIVIALRTYDRILF